MNTANGKLLQIENLVLHFKTTHGTVQAVDGVEYQRKLRAEWERDQ